MRSLRTCVLSVILTAACFGPALAADDDLTFNSQGATISPPRRTIIIAVSKGYRPALADLIDPKNWRVMYDDRLLRTEKVEPVPASFTVHLFYQAGEIAAASSREIPKNTIQVTYVPTGAVIEVQTGPVKAAKPVGSPLSGCLHFTPTDDKDKATVDITGGLQVGVDAKPQYFWSAKAGCSMLGQPAEGAGQLSLSFKSEASQQANADPDSMKAGATWLRRVPVQHRKGWIFTADPLAYEFERKLKDEYIIQDGKLVKRPYAQKNSNLMWSGMARYVTGFRPMNLSIGLVGFEAGRSLTRTVKASSNGSDQQAIVRLWFNADAYEDLFFGKKRVAVLHGHYTVRVPFKAEPYICATESGGNMYLTTKARHWTLVEMLFPFTTGLGLNVQYKRGALPPTFQFVNHQVTVGFNLLLAGN